jgi:transcription initiation factor TFIID subunit 5
MSTGTPGQSTQSPQEVATPNTIQESPQKPNVDRLVLDYLRARGYKAAEDALLESIDDSLEAKTEGPTTISSEELIQQIAVFAQKPSRPGENIFKNTSNVLQELVGMKNPTSIHDLIASLGPIGAEDILSLDPTDKQGGFRELEAWVEGSLDMYQVRELSLWLVGLLIPVTARVPSDTFPNILSLLSRSGTVGIQGCR